MYKLSTITPPAVEPVTPEELCEHARLPYDVDDLNTLVGFGIAGREYFEARTRRALVTTTFEVVYDSFDCELRLPRAPVQAITSVKYLDAAGAEQTLADTFYEVKNGRMVLKASKAYPSTFNGPAAVKIRFSAGLEDTAAVPAMAKVAIASWAALHYESREATGEKGRVVLPHSFDAIVTMLSWPEV